MTTQLDMLAPDDPNEDLIGFRWETSAFAFQVTGTSAQATYVDVSMADKESGKVIASCRPVQMVRALRSGLI